MFTLNNSVAKNEEKKLFRLTNFHQVSKCLYIAVIYAITCCQSGRSCWHSLIFWRRKNNTSSVTTNRIKSHQKNIPVMFEFQHFLPQKMQLKNYASCRTVLVCRTVHNQVSMNAKSRIKLIHRSTKNWNSLCLCCDSRQSYFDTTSVKRFVWSRHSLPGHLMDLYVHLKFICKRISWVFSVNFYWMVTQLKEFFFVYFECLPLNNWFQSSCEKYCRIHTTMTPIANFSFALLIQNKRKVRFRIAVWIHRFNGYIVDYNQRKWVINTRVISS